MLQHQERGWKPSIHPTRTATSYSNPEHSYESSIAIFPPKLKDLEFSHAGPQLRAATLPYPVPGHNAWDRRVASTNPEDFCLHSGNVSRTSQPSGTSVHSKQGPLAQWMHDHRGPWSAVAPSLVESAIDSSFDRVLDTTVTDSPPHGVADYATLRSDSGYETRQSIGTSSVFSGEINDFERDLYRQRERDSYPSYLRNEQSSPAIGSKSLSSLRLRSGPRSIESRRSNSLRCLPCNKVVKTRSELKKHELRHSKPFMCQVPDCDRTIGFSTNNDLERHVKSKHLTALGTNISVKRWKCPVPDCKSPMKTWPRQDNFRSHLLRLHKTYVEVEGIETVCGRGEYKHVVHQDLEDLQLHNTCSESTGNLFPMECDPLAVSDIMDWSPHLSDDPVHMYDCYQAGNNVEPSLPRKSQEEYLAAIDTRAYELSYTSQDVPIDPKANIGSTSTQEDFQSLDIPIDPRLTDPHYGLTNRSSDFQSIQSIPVILHSQVNSLEAAAKEPLQGTKVPDSPNTTSRQPIQEPKSDDTGNTVFLLFKDLLDGQVKPQDYASGEQLEAALKLNPEEWTTLNNDKTAGILGFIHHIRKLGYSIEKSRDDKDVEVPRTARFEATCPTCHKFTGRPCELRKHMKRHSRPYACTFDGCQKTFGSKNDWVRHEKSQHLSEGSYQCNIQTKEEGQLCAQTFSRTQAFQSHLRSSHRVRDTGAIKQKLESCLVDVECREEFWCGFCASIVRNENCASKGQNARIDHIDDHFMGRHNQTQRNIQEWVHQKEPSIAARTPSESHVEDDLLPVLRHDSTGTTSVLRKIADVTVDPLSTSDLVYTQGKSSDTDNEVSSSKPKRTKIKTKMRFCCQCGQFSNPKLEDCCSSCPERHPFCGECKLKVFRFRD